MNNTTLKKVLKSLAPQKFLIIASIFLSVLNVIFTLYFPLLIGDAINLIISKNNV